MLSTAFCRFLPIFSKIAEMCRSWGIQALCETAAEAQQAAANNDTDWQGYNNKGQYVYQPDDHPLFPVIADRRNGHKAEGSSSGSSSAGKQRQRQ